MREDRDRARRRPSASSNTSFTSPPTYGKYPSRNPCTTTVAIVRRRRGTPPRSRAPRRSRSPVGAEHDPVTATSGARCVSASRVAPHPISMSSAWAPRASTRRALRRAGEREAEHQRRRGVGRPSADAPPGSVAALRERVEPLLVLDRVHRLPEARRTGTRAARLASISRANGSIDELLAGVDLVEDVAPEHEEAAVDPHVRLLHVLDRARRRRPSSACTTCALNIGRTERKRPVLPDELEPRRSCRGAARR